MPRREYLLRAAAAETAVGGEVCNPRLEALMQVGRLEEAPLQLHVRFRNFRRHRPPRALALLLPWRGGGGRQFRNRRQRRQCCRCARRRCFRRRLLERSNFISSRGRKIKAGLAAHGATTLASAPSGRLGSDTRSSLGRHLHNTQMHALPLRPTARPRTLRFPNALSSPAPKDQDNRCLPGESHGVSAPQNPSSTCCHSSCPSGASG